MNQSQLDTLVETWSRGSSLCDGVWDPSQCDLNVAGVRHYPPDIVADVECKLLSVIDCALVNVPENVYRIISNRNQLGEAVKVNLASLNDDIIIYFNVLWPEYTLEYIRENESALHYQLLSELPNHVSHINFKSNRVFIAFGEHRRGK